MDKNESRNHSFVQDGSDQGLLLEVALHRWVSLKLGTDFLNTVKDGCSIRPTAFTRNGRPGAGEGESTLGKQYDFVPSIADKGKGLRMNSGKAALQPAMNELTSFPDSLVATVASMCYWQSRENCPPDTKWTVRFRELMEKCGMKVDPAGSESDQKNLRRWISADPDALVEVCTLAHDVTGVEVWPVESMRDDQDIAPKAKYVSAVCPSHQDGIKVRISVPKGEKAPTKCLQKDAKGQSAPLVCPLDGMDFIILKARVKVDVAAMEATIVALTAKLALQEEESTAKAA